MVQDYLISLPNVNDILRARRAQNAGRREGGATPAESARLRCPETPP